MANGIVCVTQNGARSCCSCLCFRSVRVVVRTTANFTREVEDEIQNVPGHFAMHPQLVANGHVYDFEQLSSELNVAVDAFNAR